MAKKKTTKKKATKKVAKKTTAKKTATKKAPVKKAPAKKTAKKQATTTNNKKVLSVSHQERHQMIAEAAYLRAQSRNFFGGNEVEDWLYAENEVNKKLKGYKII